ncbi:hypothetical protein C1141_18855, partial [Vibrio agarivorans]
MKDQVFTYASNYNGFSSGNVNERTGIFNFSIEIANINANQLRGPLLDINVHIDPTSTYDQGFGPGVALGLPSIDLINNIFTSSKGISVKLDVRNSKPIEPCLKDFKIVHESPSLFHVIYS